MAQLTLIVVTPEETALEQEAQFVALPLYDGEIGISPGHSPMIGRIGYGEMRLVSDGTTSRYYLDGGFVQVADNVVSVLTNRAIPSQDLTEEAALQLLEESKSLPSNTPELMEIRDRAQLQSRAQLQAIRRAK